MRWAAKLESGDDLSSRAVSSQVLSTLKGLTAVFGMGTGGSPSPLSPEMIGFFNFRFRFRIRVRFRFPFRSPLLRSRFPLLRMPWMFRMLRMLCLFGRLCRYAVKSLCSPRSPCAPSKPHTARFLRLRVFASLASLSSLEVPLVFALRALNVSVLSALRLSELPLIFLRYHVALPRSSP